MRQITFELLRHGPTNNQLLSPLTQYLALCENHAAVTVHVPFEHNQFLHRLRALSYQLGDESRVFQMKDTARVLGDLLGQVPGLVAELNRDPQERVRVSSEGTDRMSQRLTHLRVVISASELALLPVELALAPNGFPGAGQPLLLQSQEAICLTREVRRVPEEVLRWPQVPRVLFVAAAPADVDPIPMESHLAVLRRILEPWVNYADTEGERQSRLDEHLVVLEEATCDAIQQACARGSFSHVHILAHGVEYPDGFDIRYGLALHNPQDPRGKADIVGGDRLATALRAQTGGTGELARPLVVTLASCNSGNQGTVAGMGASVAHALHASGVPIVVASQFPISVPGSVVFLDILYSGLLWGEDPRVSLNDLRRRLHSQFATTHDWASLAAYVSLPSDFDRRLPDIQIGQTMRSIEVAMNYADRATAKLIKPKSQRQPTEPTTPLTDDEHASLLTTARDRIEVNRRRLEQLVDRSGDQKARVLGLLAATEKRCAEVYFSFGRIVHRKQSEPEKAEWLPLLRKARKHYWESFLLDRDSSWGVVQYLALDLLLRHLNSPGADIQVDVTDQHNDPGDLWTLAHVLSTNDIRTKDERRIKWGLANLTELYVIAFLLPSPRVPLDPEDLAKRAVQRAQDLVDRGGASSFAVYSTRRQILRYDDWYSDIADLGAVAAAVERVLAVFPVVERPTAQGSTSLED